MRWPLKVSAEKRNSSVASGVTCHAVAGPDHLADRLDLPTHHLQGVALADADDRESWVDALVDCGATRICRPGDLQAPPADWLHDGRPNVLGWLRTTSLD